MNPVIPTALPCWLGWLDEVLLIPACIYSKLRQRFCLRFFFFWFGGHLLSHTVSSAVPSAVQVLTIVFGMGTGVTPERIATKNFRLLDNPTIDNSKIPLLLSSVLVGLFQMKGNISSVLVGLFQTKESISSLERRWSSRTFRYGYLVTTSPQLSVPPSAAPSLRLGHWLRALLTPMVWRAVCTRPGNVFTATFWFAITSDSSFM